MILLTLRPHIVSAPMSAHAQFLMNVGFFSFVVVGFLPTWIALLRAHPRSGLIFVVNLFLAWTGIGWVVALVMALTNPAPTILEAHVCRNCYTISQPVVRPRKWFFGSGAWNTAKLYEALVPALSCPRCSAPNPVPLSSPAGREIAARHRTL